MTTGPTIIVPNDAELFAAAQMAAASHLHLITNGVSTLLSPIIPAGWKKLTVVAKPKQSHTPLPAALAVDWLAPGEKPKPTQKESAIADVFFAPAEAGENPETCA